MQGDARPGGGKGTMLRATLALGFVLFAAHAAFAQEPAVEAQVAAIVQKQRNFVLLADNEMTGRAVAIDVWRVEKIEGRRVYLTGEKLGVAGWASADEVVPMEKAIDYFSGQIRDQPRDAFAYVMRL